MLLVLAKDNSLLLLQQGDLSLLDEVAEEAVVASREYTGHVPIDVHFYHLVLGVTKQVAHVPSDLHDLASLLYQVYVYCAVLRTEHVDLRLLEQPFLDLLLTFELLEFHPTRTVELHVAVEDKVEQV